MLHYILQTQDKYYIHKDNSRNNLKIFYILVKVNVHCNLERSNGYVIVPNGQ
jgi:hypothetical protein